jgi:hypothetical protein
LKRPQYDPLRFSWKPRGNKDQLSTHRYDFVLFLSKTQMKRAANKRKNSSRPFAAHFESSNDKL